MARKVRLVPGGAVSPERSQLVSPHSENALEAPQGASDIVLAYVATSFFKNAVGDKGYWGALVVDPRRAKPNRIRELYGSCGVSCDYDAAIAAATKVIESISEVEGVGRALKIYAPTHVVAEMLRLATGRWRPKSRWRALQENCAAHGPIDFQYPSSGGYTGPRLRRANELARETAAEWSGVILSEPRPREYDDAP